MTFVPNSQVKLCSVPFSDYTNVLSFGTDDTKRYNYFADKTIYNLTPDAGYSYVKGTGAIRVNKNKESLYNINYMIYRNTNFSGSKWFYAFVDSIEYINANCTEIRFSIDVWQTWESALNFHESFIVRQHIPKSQDTIGANLQPEGFNNIRYVEEKRKRKDLVSNDDPSVMRIIVLASSWYDESTNTFVETNQTNTIDNNVQGLFLIPFESVIYMRNYINHYLQDNANRSKEIIAIYQIPGDFATGFTNGKPLGVTPNVTSDENEWHSNTVKIHLNKLVDIDIGPHETENIVSPHNMKLFTFPFTKIILTNNNGGSLTFRQEFFDGTRTSGDDIVFDVLNSPCLPVSAVCYPDNYREGDQTNALSLSGFPQCSWVSDSYQEWLALNQHTLAYQQATPYINFFTNQANTLVNELTGGAAGFASGAGKIDAMTSTQSKFSGIAGLIGNRIAQIGTTANRNLNNIVSTGQQIWEFYAKKGDMELQPNYSNGVTNSAQIMNAINKLCFTVIFQRPSYEQFKQIDNYFDKFGYAINDFKQVNYNNRSNFDYIETSQVLIDGDVPEDDMNTIKSIFNNGVRIWHKPDTFLNFSVANN